MTQDGWFLKWCSNLVFSYLKLFGTEQKVTLKGAKKREVGGRKLIQTTKGNDNFFTFYLFFPNVNEKNYLNIKN